MPNFCTKCGAELINGVCPNCSEAQAAVQYKQPEAQYQQQPFVEQDTDERLKSFFINPKEKFVCALGNGYLQTFLDSGALGKGFALVSDKRVYFKGKAFEMRGGEFNKKSVTATVDLKDVTGTETKKINPIALLVWGIVFAALAICLFLIDAAMLNDLYYSCLSGLGTFSGFIFLLPAILFIVNYFAKRKKVLIIMFDGIGIAFPVNWFPAKEGENFQKMLRIAKGQAVEEAENATAMREVLANTVALQPQAAVSAADELAKYAQLYKDGMITEQEFADIKAKLLTKQ